MKKVLFLCMFLLIIPSVFIAAGEAAAPEELEGAWYLTGLTEDGQTYNAADVGFEMTLTLNADGSAESAQMDQSASGSWSVSGTDILIAIDGDEMPFVFSDGLLSCDLGDGTVMTFSREAPVSFVPAESIPAADVSQFDGTWNAEMVDAYGMILPVESLLEDLSFLIGMDDTLLVIDAGSVRRFRDDSVEAFQFADGILRKDAEKLEGIDEEFLEETISLLEDRGLSYTVMDMTFFCTRADGEVSLPAESVGTEFAGTWYLHTMNDSGSEIPASGFGVEMTMTLFEDGNARGENGGEVSSGTWKMDGQLISVTIDGDEALFEALDGALVTTLPDGMKLTFRQEPPVDAYIPAQPISAEDAAQFNGTWTAEMADVFGVMVPVDAVRDEIGFLIPMDSLEIVLQDGVVTRFGEAFPQTFSLEGGELAGEEEETIALLEDGMLSYSYMGIVLYCSKADSSQNPEGSKAYEGIWYAVDIKTGAAEGNPRDMWGLTITLTLNPDGTGCLDYAGADEGMIWYRDDESGLFYYGKGEDADTPISLTPDGFLQFGTPQSGCILFSRSPDDGLTNTSENLPAEPQAESADISGDIFFEHKYLCAGAQTGGITLDASLLGGEYSVVFHEEGNADLILAGTEMPALMWTAKDGAYAVNCYGNELVFVPVEDQLELDYMGAMKLTLKPE